MNAFDIPGFEMIEIIGQGGMATVWKARQISLDRIVAIKILSAQFANDPSDVELFQIEAQQTAKLKHPGIVQVHDASVEKGVYYIVMEHVAGYTVGEWMRRKGVLTEKDAILVCEHVAEALDYAWRKARIIHCDIKPDNIIVDSDGSVKVADLGLSRTINAMCTTASREGADIMGTPAYIAPEQAMGLPDLDCRVDIYALGAMLYQLVTGRPLFEGCSESRSMEMQVSETAPDAQELNPKLSSSLCTLIERMLAKKRESRYSDWTSVRTDLARIKKGMPVIRHAIAGGSTMRRSATRVVVVPPRRAVSEEKGTGLSLPVIIALAAAVAVIVAVGFQSRQHRPVCARPSLQTEELRPPPLSGPAPGHPAPASPVPEPPRQPGNDFRRAPDVREGDAERVLRPLAEETAGLIRDGRFAEAAGIYESYSGPLASETDKRRAAIAAELRSRDERMKATLRVQQAAAAEAKMSNLLERVSLELVSAGVEPALTIIREAAENAELASRQNEIRAVQSLLDSAADTDRRIMESFKAQRGEEITVQLTNGLRRLTIISVQDGRVSGQQELRKGGTHVNIGISFEARDLSSKEKLQRMGSEESRPDAALVKGLMALNAKAFAHARKCLALTHPLLADRLVALASNSENDALADEKKVAPPQPAGPVEADPERPKPADAAGGQAPPPVKEAGASISEDLLRSRLLDRNPEMPARECSVQADKAGAVIRAEIVSVHLMDIGAIAAAKDLKDLSCGAPPGTVCKLKDLSALRGLPLESLCVSGAGIRDLAFLRGLPLKRLVISHCPVSDLTPLKEIVSLEELQLSGTEVRDISPLRGMKIQRLNLGATRVADIRMLSGMPLTSLDISDTPVKDITVTKEMPLRSLNLARTRIFNFSVLNGMSLTSLNIDDTQFRDLSLLKGVPLKSLFMANVGIPDLSSLRGHQLVELSLVNGQARDYSVLADMPIRFLNMSGSRVDDLAFAKNLPLENLDLSNTRIADLAPLKGKTLQVLHIGNTRVRDLQPLEGMPLQHLNCQNADIANFAPLKQMPLRSLVMNEPNVSTRRILRSLPKLLYLNGLPYEH